MLRTIVITGVSRGLGRALVEGFQPLGHRIAGCARNAAEVEILRQRMGSPHTFDVVDVVDEEAVGQWAARVLNDHGPPDLLINNAGVIHEPMPLWKVAPDELARVFDVNVRGVHHVIRHFVPAMVARKKGVIVNMSSGWGRSTSAGVAPYCGSKWAIEGLTQALAEELPRGMAAIPLNPGIINTDMLATCFGEDSQHYPKAQEWAQKAVPFLLSLTHQQNGHPLTTPQ
jgi:NAD(P)-dependent dehydrogenase (short-subunit alcohol dehydrogenase family)